MRGRKAKRLVWWKRTNQRPVVSDRLFLSSQTGPPVPMEQRHRAGPDVVVAVHGDHPVGVRVGEHRIKVADAREVTHPWRRSEGLDVTAVHDDHRSGIVELASFRLHGTNDKLAQTRHCLFACEI